MLVDEKDVEGDFEHASMTEAQVVGTRLGHAVVERVYEYVDSELVWTPDGADTWPPRTTPTPVRARSRRGR